MKIAKSGDDQKPKSIHFKTDIKNNDVVQDIATQRNEIEANKILEHKDFFKNQTLNLTELSSHAVEFIETKKQEQKEAIKEQPVYQHTTKPLLSPKAKEGLTNPEPSFLKEEIDMYEAEMAATEVKHDTNTSESVSNKEKQDTKDVVATSNVKESVLFKAENFNFYDPKPISKEAKKKIDNTESLKLGSPKTFLIETDLNTKDTLQFSADTKSSFDMKMITDKMAFYKKNLKQASESVLQNSKDLGKFLPFLKNNINKEATEINSDSFAFAAEPMILEDESIALEDIGGETGIEAIEVLGDATNTGSFEMYLNDEGIISDIITNNNQKTGSTIEDESIIQAPETSVSESSLYLNQKSDILHALMQEKTTHNPFHILPDSQHLKDTFNSYNSSVASYNWSHKNFILVFSLYLYLYFIKNDIVT